MTKYLKNFGALRVLLITAAIALAVLAPEPGTAAARSGWEVIPTLIAPAMTPLVFMVLMFDFMMCRVRMTDEPVRKKFRIISYVELTTAFILLLIWLPFFLAIGRQT